MSIVNNEFTAAPSAAGIFYQARMALALCIPHVNTASMVEVAIERLDDISFEVQGTALELLQTKHHIDRVASLSDSSVDLWKTLRVWAVRIADDPSLPSRTRLVLLTTGGAPEGSAAAMLRTTQASAPGFRRDPKSAQEVLSRVASSSTNEALKPAFQAFLSLTPRQRSALLSAVEILDDQPLLPDLDAVLEEALRLVVPRGKAAAARELLEGWWWPTVCKAILATPPETISVASLEAKLDEIRESFRRDALVAEFENASPTDAEAAALETFRFVSQLHAIEVGALRISYAKRDYYRAFAQRSKWTREHVVLDEELAKFEAVLIEEWEPRFGAMCERVASGDAEPASLRNAGQQLYQWVETEARFPLRSLTARFLNVGSYHMLANDLRVGWHRDYEKLCG